ncbi:MAG TPA: 50S ribosomal protein L25 [Candidatus Latescibacteria bacterium]|nr:50S ribosomal protein L25 [Gemmatimonadota bacterium]HCR16837.1 50S ribosomal protein L25 [Candidatus Latescibacterota bacterium]|tara:strand:- start:20 stop:694 length:675 start_codon:yes stop_codon:yes gene_type:complete
MADNVVLKADRRTQVGKQAVKHLRLKGRLPAVVYGEKQDPIVCSVDRKELEVILHDQGRNALLSLDLPDGQAQDTTIIKEIQHHPLKGEMQHVDFHRISLTEKIIVEVAVEAEGNPVGVRTEGGILEHMLYELEVECLPTDIPDKVVFDVTEMSIGDTIHVSDLVVEGNVEIVTESDRSVFVLVPPTVAQVAEDEEEEEALEEEEMQEPEVIERGKRDEEEEEE